MNVCIVGHGPSLKGAGLGSKIDSYDKVVRLKGSQAVLWTNDFGGRADALCSSTEIMGTFFKMHAGEYWGYPKKGEFDERIAMKTLKSLQQPIMIPLGFVNTWNARFRQMGATHPNVSTGMAAILIAIHRWKPSEIILAGFDTMLDPTIEFSRHTKIPRSGFGKYPGHDWAKENELLSVLRDAYNMEIICIPMISQSS